MHFDWHTFTNISLFKIHRLYVVCRINPDCLLQVMVEIIALIDLEAVLAPRLHLIMAYFQDYLGAIVSIIVSQSFNTDIKNNTAFSIQQTPTLKKSAWTDGYNWAREPVYFRDDAKALLTKVKEENEKSLEDLPKYPKPKVDKDAQLKEAGYEI